MNKKGFTLLEMLVVVLIIGILSSIALPQYQKAIKKARVAEAVTVGKKLLEAEQLYFLENREFTTDMSKLRIRVRDLKNFQTPTATISSSKKHVDIVMNGKDVLNGINFTFMAFTSGEYFIAAVSSSSESIKFLPCPPKEVKAGVYYSGGTIGGYKSCKL